MEKQEEKDWVGLLGERSGFERKIEKLTFIENLLCANDDEIVSDYEIMIIWFWKALYLFMLSNLTSIPILWDSGYVQYFTNEENEPRVQLFTPSNPSSEWLSQRCKRDLRSYKSCALCTGQCCRRFERSVRLRSLPGEHLGYDSYELSFHKFVDPLCCSLPAQIFKS